MEKNEVVEIVNLTVAGAMEAWKAQDRATVAQPEKWQQTEEQARTWIINTCSKILDSVACHYDGQGQHPNWIEFRNKLQTVVKEELSKVL